MARCRVIRAFRYQVFQVTRYDPHVAAPQQAPAPDVDRLYRARHFGCGRRSSVRRFGELALLEGVLTGTPESIIELLWIKTAIAAMEKMR